APTDTSHVQHHVKPPQRIQHRAVLRGHGLPRAQDRVEERQPGPEQHPEGHGVWEQGPDQQRAERRWRNVFMHVSKPCRGDKPAYQVGFR
ncbi:hypothetical protein Bpfe_013043, partial [Biomphalaria pfeifferi]